MKAILLGLIIISSFIIGMIVQTEICVNRLKEIHISQDWGDGNYEAVWYIITGNTEEN
jgi:hypothetical protein